jgi:hypothetical protein
MGFTITAYCIQFISGGWLFYQRRHQAGAGLDSSTAWVQPLHVLSGIAMVLLVLLLLAIGIVGTLGEFGRLGQSVHLVGGVSTVGLVLASAWSATAIRQGKAWARSLHITLNAILCLALIFVTWSGWTVVQKYLP